MAVVALNVLMAVRANGVLTPIYAPQADPIVPTETTEDTSATLPPPDPP